MIKRLPFENQNLTNKLIINTILQDTRHVTRINEKKKVCIYIDCYICVCLILNTMKLLS